MNRLKGCEIALGAVLLILALVLVVNLTSERAASAPLPGEIFIDHNGNRTYDIATETLYLTIQDAINASSTGDAIVVGSGFYEENLVVNVAGLSIVGPNENMDPIYGPRLPEAVVTPALTGATVNLQAISVTLNGLTFEGFNPNGSVAATCVIQNSQPSDGATITYNIIRNGTDGISLDGSVAPGVGVLGTTINFNVIGNFSNAGAGTGVTLISDYFADVSLNLITDVDIGVLVRDMSLAGSPESVTSNTIDSRTYGIQVQSLFGMSDVWTISTNDVRPTTPGINTGIYISGVAANATVDLNFNFVHDCSIGLELQDNPTLMGITSRMELYINNSMGACIVTGLISGVDLPNNYTFAAVEIDDSFIAINMVDLGDITSLTTLSVQESSYIIGGTDGIWVTGPLMVLIVNDTTTLIPLEFNTVAGNYITLANNARYIDATFVSFDGQTGGAMTLAQNFAVEDKVTHALDFSGLGLVQWKADNAFVTPSSGSIQRGIDVLMATVHVNTGTYVGELSITNMVVIEGAAPGAVSIVANDPLVSTYVISTSPAIMVGLVNLTISGPAANLYGGLLVQSGSLVVLSHVAFVNVYDTVLSNFSVAIDVEAPGLAATLVLDNVTIDPVQNGLLLTGSGATVVPLGPYPLNFTGVSDQYIILNACPNDVDATSMRFEGLLGSEMTLAQNFAVEDKVTHALDTSGLGFVQWKADNDFVTQTSGSIQGGIDIGVLNVNVAAGSYTEALVIINPFINLLGNGSTLSNVVAPNLGSPYWLVTIDGSSAFVQGFTFRGPDANLLGGVLLINSASAQFLGVEFESLRDNGGSQSVWAMQVGNATTSAYVDVQSGLFTGFSGGAIKIMNAPLGFNIFNNDITGFGTGIGDFYGQVGVKVENAVGGSIDTNRFTSFAGTEIGSCVEVDAQSTGLNIMHNAFTGSNVVDDGAAAIRMIDFGPTFVTLTGNNFTMWGLAVAIDGANHLLFADNYFTSNPGTAMGLHATNDTTILRGAFNSNHNGIVALSFAVNNTAHDVNFQGNDFALINTYPDVFDARFNWWGHVTGPGGNAPGLGDPIIMSFANNILYNPWLGASFPPEILVNGTFLVMNATHPVFFQGVGLNLTASMTGTGDHTVVILQYFGNPNGVVYWKDANVYFDFLIMDTTGIDQVELRAYYDPLSLPPGIVESELRGYWSDSGVWKACSDSGVNVVQHYVWVLIRSDTSPSLAQVSGTPFLLGSPVAIFDPTAGNIGSLVSALDGAGFNPNLKVTLYLEDTPIAQTFTDASGNFSFVRGFIPGALPGLYNIRMQDDLGFVVSGEFTVLDTTPIDITLDVGSLYFPGEVVTWYVLFTLDGQLLDPDFVVANLYAPDDSVTDLSGDLNQITMGLWTVSTTLAGDALPGEYTLVITANLIPTNYGATLRTFLVSPTLVDQYSRIMSMDSNITTIQTSIGLIMVNLSQISANLTSIEGTLATIQTSIGTLQADVSFINATLLSVQGTLVTIQTDIGSIVENISAINGRLTAIEGDIATIQTDIGDIQVNIADINAHLISIDGTMATIQTDIGNIQENCSAVNTRLTAIEGRLATIESDVGTIMVNVSQINARLASIEGRLATIETDIGTIVVNITAIKAQIVAIDGTLATIQTDIGACKANLTAIRAELVSVNMTVGTLSTTVGTLTVSLSALNITVTRIDHNVATILTNMGTLTGRVTSLEGNVATIQTDIGTIKANVTAVQKLAGETGGNNALVLGALGAGVIAALGGVVLLLRRKP